MIAGCGRVAHWCSKPPRLRVIRCSMNLVFDDGYHALLDVVEVPHLHDVAHSSPMHEQLEVGGA